MHPLPGCVHSTHGFPNEMRLFVGKTTKDDAMSEIDFDIAVIGGGLAGQLAALAFADRDFSVALVAPDQTRADGRTTALMDESLETLRRLGLWDAIHPHAAALQTMQIIDGTGRLLRAPTVAFKAAEIGLDAFGYNIPNQPFNAVLAARIENDARITRYVDEATGFAINDDHAVVTLSNGNTIRCGLLVGADGRRSPVREAAGLSTRTWSYPQTALVLNFRHTQPHGQVSTEFHTPHGPFTQVPLPGLMSSLVWVNEPTEAERLAALPLEDLSRAIETRMQSMLGKVTVDGSVQAWPMSGMTANRFGARSAILIGEAAHVFPPIGAQGLNLSLRDLAAAVELAVSARREMKPLAIGEAFDRARRADILSRTASVDLLNRSLLSSFLPVQMLRTAGLAVLGAVPPLRQMVMNEGVAPGRSLRNLPGLIRERLQKRRGSA